MGAQFKYKSYYIEKMNGFQENIKRRSNSNYNLKISKRGR
jgi:hypothetical protein